MQFGVTFYPDQYPKEVWEKEFLEIKNVGFEIVRFNEMSWGLLEEKDGKFNFKDLDLALSICGKIGLKVILGVPTSQAPQWLINKHPEISPVSSDGQKHPIHGPRPNACKDNNIFKKYAERLTAKLAQRYKNHPALSMWQIDNEPNYPPLDLTSNKDYCHCPATRKAFILWSKEKYKTLANLNEAWGTKFWGQSFSSFEEISTPPAGMWDAFYPAIYLDWFRFKSEQLSKWLKDLKKIIRKHDKNHKIGTNNFTTIINRASDHRILAEGMDFYGWDIYPKGTNNSNESLSQIADFWRSICQNAKSDFIVSELQGGDNVRWGYPGHVTGEDIKKWVQILSDKGTQIILFHNWLPPLFGPETGGFGLKKPDGTPTEKLAVIKEIIQQRVAEGVSTSAAKLRQLGIRADTAIYYSHSSDIETYQEEGPARPNAAGWFSGRGDLGMFFGNNSIAGAYKILWQDKIAPDFIFEQDIDKLNNYKIVLLTNPYLLDISEYLKIRDFVEKGGILISDSRFGLKDEHSTLNKKPFLEEFLKIEYLHTEIIENEIGIKGSNSKAYGFRDVIKPKGNKVLFSFEDGSPAVIEKNIGDGKIIYASFSLFASFIKSENKKILSYLRKSFKK